MSMPNNKPGYDTSKVVSEPTKRKIEDLEGAEAATEILKERAEKISNSKKMVTNLAQFLNSGIFKDYEYKTEGNTDPTIVAKEANRVLDELEDTEKNFKFLQDAKEEVTLNNKPMTQKMFNKLMSLSLDALKSNIDLKQTKYKMGKLDLIDQRIKNLMPKEKIAS